jgi:3-hydroxyisobutyrate dehydrogenase-like beta-hydroxyacid dehydrogenase
VDPGCFWKHSPRLRGQLRAPQSRHEVAASDRHPTEGAFPTSYIIKDLAYALGLAESAGVTLEQAQTTKRLMERTAAAGYADHYYTAVLRVIEKP